MFKVSEDGYSPCGLHVFKKRTKGPCMFCKGTLKIILEEVRAENAAHYRKSTKVQRNAGKSPATQTQRAGKRMGMG